MRDCTICVVKTKALISCAVTAQLICVFVFAYAKSRYSHDEAQLEIDEDYGTFLFQIKYTEGGENNLVMARSYFAQAAKLNPNNMRAQYGLLLVSCF